MNTFVERGLDEASTNLTSIGILDSESSLMRAVALDCEMVRVARNRKALARVCIVGWDEAVLFDSFVRPTASVVDYETRYSGVTAQDLESAPSFEVVRSHVEGLVAGRLVVGHAVKNDLKVLHLGSHPSVLVVDTQAFPWGAERKTNLKALCHELLRWEIQCGPHNPAEDAIASLRLLKHFRAHGMPAARHELCELNSENSRQPPIGAPSCSVVPGEEGGMGRGAGDEPCLRWMLSLRWSAVAVKDLLWWFRCEQRAGRATSLLFSTSLSKEDRAIVHKAAEALKLDTISSGISNDRAIRVRRLAAKAVAPPHVQHLASLIMWKAREHAPEMRTTATATARMPTLDELRELLLTGIPLALPYAHLEPLRMQGEVVLRRAYARQPTVPELAVGTKEAATLSLAAERQGALTAGF